MNINSYSPLDLSSTEEVVETLQRHTRPLGNGAVGVDFRLLSVPNLKNSEVYKMLSEEEPQLRYMHRQQISAVTSEFSERKRVAWPPPANPIETIETRKYGYDNGTIGIPIQQQQQQPNPYPIFQPQNQEAYISPPTKQLPNVFFPPKQQDYDLIPQKLYELYQNRPEDLPLNQPVTKQQSPKVPPPPPPRVHRKPILRSYSDAQVSETRHIYIPARPSLDINQQS